MSFLKRSILLPTIIRSARTTSLRILPSSLASINVAQARCKSTKKQALYDAPISKRGKDSSSKTAAPEVPTPEEAHSDADSKMRGSIDWFKGVVSKSEARASGRVSAALLDKVKVPTPDGLRVLLPEVATVGVKEGSTLVVTVFDEEMTRVVEKALNASGIPGVIPQRASETVIRIPIAKPTVESREQFYNEAKKDAEKARIQIRAVREAGMKVIAANDLPKHSPQAKRMQKLCDDSIAKVDEALKAMRKTFDSM